MTAEIATALLTVNFWFGLAVGIALNSRAKEALAKIFERFGGEDSTHSHADENCEQAGDSN